MNAKAEKKIEKAKKIVTPILKKYGVTKAGFFGSFVRGEMKKNSDIDILVEFPEEAHISLLDFAHIQNEITDAIRNKVDLVEYCVVRKEIKKNIFSEEVKIL